MMADTRRTRTVCSNTLGNAKLREVKNLVEIKFILNNFSSDKDFLADRATLGCVISGLYYKYLKSFSHYICIS
jgi:hypothetical protein